jgi:hypothetical protein
MLQSGPGREASPRIAAEAAALRPRRRRRAPGHWQLSPGLPVYDSELARPGNIRPHPRAAGAYRAVDVDAP